VGGYWNRLQSTPQKPHWLKIDFDRWQSDDIDDIVEDINRDVMKDYPKMYDKLQKEEYGYIKEKGRTVYLILYNLSQFIGFLYITMVMSIRYYRDGPNSMAETYGE
jgi:very-long-chain (3R)-3-hydroxyacyl-CoA dehydratase